MSRTKQTARPSVSNTPTKGTGGIRKPPIGSVRHRNRLSKPTLDRISRNSILRLARRAGVKRVERKLTTQIRLDLKEFLEDLLRDALTVMESAKRKTIDEKDVKYALSRIGNKLYGN